MDFKAFILRSKVISLYRKAWRVANQAPSGAREELKSQIRQDFEASRAEADRPAIVYLVSLGKQRLKELEDMLNLRA